MVKLKRSPKKRELVYKCSKNGQFRLFFAASSKFRGKRRIQRRGVKIRVARNTAGRADHVPTTRSLQLHVQSWSI